MPELPEVENVRRSLEQLVVGRTIDHVEVRLPRIIRSPDDIQRFAAELQGGTIAAVDRRGKYLLFTIPPYVLVSHLRMEGQYRLCDAGDPEEPHTHVVFAFTDGAQLRYRDVRQFGTMDLVPASAPLPSGLKDLGPEPFDPALDVYAFYRLLHRRRAPVKAVLLDQTTLAGLGNIYVDEALFGAGIHPERPAHKVRPGRGRTLARCHSRCAATRDRCWRFLDPDVSQRIRPPRRVSDGTRRLRP